MYDNSPGEESNKSYLIKMLPICIITAKCPSDKNGMGVTESWPVSNMLSAQSLCEVGT